MNLIKIGNYIMTKRKELTLTQEQLAEKVGVSSKTISKWECGKSLPDHHIIELLCNVLKITTSELINGEDNSKNDDKQNIEMIERIQKLENQKNTIFGILLIILGIACFSMAQLFNGSNAKDFISGVLTGLSIVEMLVGIYVAMKSVAKQ